MIATWDLYIPSFVYSFLFPSHSVRTYVLIVDCCRDYSMYSTSTNEGSVGRARNDLDRCAHILNEVIDNGAGILGKETLNRVEFRLGRHQAR